MAEGRSKDFAQGKSTMTRTTTTYIFADQQQSWASILDAEPIHQTSEALIRGGNDCVQAYEGVTLASQEVACSLVSDGMSFVLFCISFVLTTSFGLIAPKRLDTNGTLGPMLGVHPLQLTDHNTSISLLLSTSAWVLLSPPIERRETKPTA